MGKSSSSFIPTVSGSIQGAASVNRVVSLASKEYGNHAMQQGKRVSQSRLLLRKCGEADLPSCSWNLWPERRPSQLCVILPPPAPPPVQGNPRRRRQQVNRIAKSRVPPSRCAGSLHPPFPCRQSRAADPSRGVRRRHDRDGTTGHSLWNLVSERQAVWSFRPTKVQSHTYAPVNANE